MNIHNIVYYNMKHMSSTESMFYFLEEDDRAEIEWDVRSCKSFIEEHGRWQKLRPGLDIPK